MLAVGHQWPSPSAVHKRELGDVRQGAESKALTALSCLSMIDSKTVRGGEATPACISCCKVSLLGLCVFAPPPPRCGCGPTGAAAVAMQRLRHLHSAIT